MANSNPVIPVMDWTEVAELHKRYVEWREKVEWELGSSLSGKSNTVKSNYMLRWAGKPARAKRVCQNQSSNMREQVQRPYYKPKKKRLNQSLMKLQPSSNSTVQNKVTCLCQSSSVRQGDWQNYTTTQTG